MGLIYCTKCEGETFKIIYMRTSQFDSMQAICVKCGFAFTYSEYDKRQRYYDIERKMDELGISGKEFIAWIEHKRK